MALGKQAKTLSKGQVEAVLAYLAKTRQESAHLSPVRQGRPQGKGDSQSDLEDGRRYPGRSRTSHLPRGQGQQGSVGPSHPHERGVASCSRRILRNHMDFEQSLHHQKGEGQEHVRSGNRQYVCRWYRELGSRMLESQWASNSSPTLRGRFDRWIIEGRSDAAGHTNLRRRRSTSTPT
jgi:hypothetical protein